MSEKKIHGVSRREALKTTGRAAAAVAAISNLAMPSLYAASTDLIQVALVGCGGRGTGAASQALSTTSGPIKLVAMADVFDTKLSSSYQRLTGSPKIKAQVDVPEDRKYIGFDGYKKAMDCLKPGDVVILATPRVPLGAVLLRDRKGIERVHGEARHRGRPDNPGRCSRRKSR
ncbi:MAG: hypothetical protein U0903_19890 [Planctomycetales bacterium]